ncbi:MAG TPA: glycine cleavage system aminomethyltransferase GcvT [Bacillota bacterium]|nr:glycine cleavage system aminomethyltransferase GcvT [Bacillota bacterium]
MTKLKKTPLYTRYENMAKIVDFAGWAMPIRFEGIVQEHHAVRKMAGLFDVSHMGEIEVSGDDAQDFLNYLLSNDILKLSDNRVQYTLLLNEKGGIIDDVLVYMFSKNRYWIIANASNKDKDYKWLKRHAEDFSVSVRDLSSSIAQIAIQGPNAAAILKAHGCNSDKIKFFHFVNSSFLNSKECLISRTGYTGEDGFEIYLDKENAPALWDYLLENSKDHGLVACGLGCRDTLRFEAGLMLYGQDLSEDSNPFELGLDRFIGLEKEIFIGKAALEEQMSLGLHKKLIGFEMQDRGIPRSGYDLYKDQEKIGRVTSGNYSPTLSKNLGMALVDIDQSMVGNSIDILIRNRMLNASVVKIPFYNKRYKK